MPLPSPVPSRAALIANMQGDPFLGALIPALGGLVAKVAPKVGSFFAGLFRGGKGAAAAAAGAGTRAASVGARVSAAPGRPASRAAMIAQVKRIGGTLLPAVGAGAAAAAAGAGLQFALGPDGELIRPRRRRMNPLNPKALRRATRRLSSFNKMAKKTQSELAKLAPPRARRAPGRHHHHDDHHHGS